MTVVDLEDKIGQEFLFFVGSMPKQKENKSIDRESFTFHNYKTKEIKEKEDSSLHNLQKVDQPISLLKSRRVILHITIARSLSGAIASKDSSSPVTTKGEVEDDLMEGNEKK